MKNWTGARGIAVDDAMTACALEITEEMLGGFIVFGTIVGHEFGQFSDSE